MPDQERDRGTSPHQLLTIIGQVRSRWRLKLALRGALRMGLIVAVLLIAAAYGIERARYASSAVWAARGIFLAAVIGTGYWFVLRPLRRQVSDDQVALYLEEQEPTLQATLLSAVEASRAGRPESAALVQRVVEQAVDACSRTGASRRVEQNPLRGYAAGIAVAAVAALALVVTGPAFIRQALGVIFQMTRVQAAVPFSIEVKPGNASVPKGSDQTISATLRGFDTEDATLMASRAADGKFEPVPLVRNDDGTWEAVLFDINAPLTYFIEADGVRTPVFTMKVVEVPYAQRIALEYRFPAYTGLEPQKIEDGGDVAVLKGTDVRVQVFPTMKTTAGRLALGDNRFADLVAQPDGSLVASFTADKDGFYHVELVAPNGERVTGSPQYTIDVLEDRAPTVSFIRPGRDTTASAVEEVFVEAKAEDDFGVRDLELVYSVNGGEEKVVKLFQGSKRLPEVSAGHTFYLEELGVQVGDSVSYFARAMDNDGAAGVKKVSSDLYFLRVRPFSKDFRQAQSQGGGGGGGGGGGMVEALSEQQRQIISATFNVQRDRRTFTPDKLRQSSTVVALSQSRLREQVEALLTRMNSQLVQQDPAFAKIAELMPQAVAAMKDAETRLSASTPESALPFEHKALQVLQKAEEEYELQVTAGQQGGGGGGGGGAMQQELAEIFEQQLDKLASRYETANQSMQQEGDRQVDELLEKLKELARRQEQEAERQRRRALDGQQASGGSGGAGGNGGSGGNSGAQQRALADQVEEAARRLERLAREEERQDLADAARQMREAADAMRKAAAGGDGNAAAQAQAALERLRDTERRLQRGQTQRAERDIAQAKAQAEELERRQREIADQAKNLAGIGTSERAQQSRAINEKKDALESKLGELESQLDRAARDASGEEKAASRKLAEAAGVIRDNRLRDYVRYSRQMVSRGRNQAEVNAAENSISQGLEEVRRRIDAAGAALGMGGGNASAEGKQEKTLDRARRLARGAESLAERTRERAQQQRDQGREGEQQARNDQDQNSQDGKQGQNGKGGQQGQGQGPGKGQQGQQGQQGQGGSQGQGQQGEGQGQGQGQGQGSQGGDGQRADAGGGAWTNGGVDRGGAWNGGAAWGGWWDGRDGRLSPEDVRQLRNDARQYANDARDLRGQLRGQDIDPKELEGVMNALRELEDDRVYQNVSELMRLQAAVAEGLKRFEFALRRKVEGDANKAALSSADNVPSEFRPLVEQYYRSLGRSPR